MAAPIDLWEEYNKKGVIFSEFDCPCPQNYKGMGSFLLDKIHDKPFIYNLVSMVTDITPNVRINWFDRNLCVKMAKLTTKTYLRMPYGDVEPPTKTKSRVPLTRQQILKLLQLLLGSQLVEECRKEADKWVCSLKPSTKGEFFIHIKGISTTRTTAEIPGPKSFIGMIFRHCEWSFQCIEQLNKCIED